MSVNPIRATAPMSVLCLSFLGLVVLGGNVAQHSAAEAPVALEDSRKTAESALSRAHMEIVENRGQHDPRVRFAFGGRSHRSLFLEGGVVHHFTKANGGHEVANLAIFVDHQGADPRRIDGLERTAHRMSFMRGNDSDRWQSNVPTYRSVRYESLYRGVDLVYIPTPDGLKYEYRLAPGSNVEDIRLHYRGVESLLVDALGNLEIETAWGAMRDRAPVSYQLVGGTRVEVHSSYRLIGDHTVGFAAGSYRGDLELVIDPQLEYSTYLGGGYDDEGLGIAVSGGNIYVTGHAGNADNTADPFPTTPGAYDTTGNGDDAWSDAFVSVISPGGNGSADLLYSTVLGGSGSDYAHDITVSGGQVYVVGFTLSSNFPTTPGAYDPAGGLGYDAFVSVFDSTLSTLLYSTLLAGGDRDEGNSLSVADGKIYVSGQTNSSDFPTTPGAFDTTFGGGSDVYLSVINPAGGGSTDLLYSTLLGGDTADYVWYGCLAVSNGRAYIAGSSQSTDFPTTPGAYDRSYNGRRDAFVSVLDPAGAGPGDLLYSTWLGGGHSDYPGGIALAGGAVYVTGTTWWSHDLPRPDPAFPTTPGAFDTYLGDNLPPSGISTNDAFVSVFDSTLSTLQYSSYFGGTNSESGQDIAISAGNMYLVGYTTSSEYDGFPTTLDAYDDTFDGGVASFVAVLNPGGAGATDLVYSTYIGGIGIDRARAVGVHNGAACVAGNTGGEFPTTPGAFDDSTNGFKDAMVFVLQPPGLSTLLFEDGFETGNMSEWSAVNP